MNISEANKIFKIWSQWFWPFHFILNSIFISAIPESFLPFPKNILEKALNIVAKKYHESGDLQSSKDIQRSIVFLNAYVNDKDAFRDASNTFNNPEFGEAISKRISKFNKDWLEYVSKHQK